MIRLVCWKKRSKENDSLRQFKKELTLASEMQPLTLRTGKQALERLVVLSTKILADTDNDPRSESYRWAEALTRQIQDHLENLFQLAPWLLLPPPPVRLADIPFPDEIPSLHELEGMPEAWSPEIDRWYSGSDAGEAAPNSPTSLGRDISAGGVTTASVRSATARDTSGYVFSNASTETFR